MSIRKWTVALCLALLGVIGPAAGVSAAPAPQQARTVLLAYLDALQRGDAPAASALLGCELRTKRLPLLRNPHYGPRLLDSYRDARFALSAPRVVGGDGVAFSATISSPDREATRRVFLLRRVERGTDTATPAPYRVCAEGEPGEAGF